MRKRGNTACGTGDRKPGRQPASAGIAADFARLRALYAEAVRRNRSQADQIRRLRVALAKSVRGEPIVQTAPDEVTQ